MRLIILSKGRKRPIGYKTPAGYVKTSKGWRKVSGKGVVVQPVEKEAKQVEKKFASLPSLDKLRAMNNKELVSYNAQMFNVRVLDKITKQNREMWNNITYQTEMLHHLGFKNPSRLAITVEDVTSSSNNIITAARYSILEKKITVGKKYQNSFVHEYFHHLWHKSLTDARRVRFQRTAETTKSYERFVEIDRRRGGLYYAQPTEMAARFGNQLVHKMLKERSVDAAVKMVSGPMIFSYPDFTERDFAYMRNEIKTFSKAFRKLPLVLFTSEDKEVVE